MLEHWFNRYCGGRSVSCTPPPEKKTIPSHRFTHLVCSMEAVKWAKCGRQQKKKKKKPSAEKSLHHWPIDNSWTSKAKNNYFNSRWWEVLCNARRHASGVQFSSSFFYLFTTRKRKNKHKTGFVGEKKLRRYFVQTSKLTKISSSPKKKSCLSSSDVG